MRTLLTVLLLLCITFGVKSQNIDTHKKKNLVNTQVELAGNPIIQDTLKKTQPFQNPIGKADLPTTSVIQRTEKKIMQVNPKKSN
jgi:hypothetical protein